LETASLKPSNKGSYDQSAPLEAAVPELARRLDHSRVAVVEHSFGEHSAGMILGTQLTDEDGTKVKRLLQNFEQRLQNPPE
jgi:predicted dienelactone hydrolase